MSRAFWRLVIGLAGAGVIALGCWGLQAAALPAPTPAEQVAARATFALQAHRLLLDRFGVDHSTTTGACLRGWFPQGTGPRVRGSLFALRGGAVWLTAGLRTISLVRGRRLAAGRAWLEAALGCSRQLQDLLVEAARTGFPLGGKPSHVAGEAAFALRLPTLDPRVALEVSGRTYRLVVPRMRAERLTLYVAQQTSRPLLVVAVLGRRKMFARLSFVRVTQAIRARFGLGAAPQPGR